LWSKIERGKARKLRFAAADADGPAPVVLGRPWDGTLPYAVGRTVFALSAFTGRTFSLTVRERVVALTAHAGGMAAILADGAVLAIRPGQPVVERAYAPGDASAAVLTSRGLVVKTKSGLEVHWDEKVRTVPLPAGARFLGLAQGLFAYSVGPELRLRRIDGTGDKLLRRLAPGFHAQLSHRGVAYASGRTLGFRTWVTL
jgi:hypothetical protein